MKCKNCGQELENGMKFCTNCGCPIDDAPSPQTCTKEDNFILVTTPSIPNYRIVSVFGTMVSSWIEIAAKRSGLFEAIDALSGNLGGDSYLSSVEEKCHVNASKRLVNVAINYKCNAVVGLRFNTVYSDGVIHVTAYGTACVVEQDV